MAGGEKTGIDAAVRATIGTGDLLDTRPEEEQLDLLGFPPTKDGRPILPRRNGRPPGKRSYRTQEWIDYLLTKYPSPLEGLLAIANLGIEELAQGAKCSLLEALDRKIKCLSEAAPFLHSKLASIELKPPGSPGGPSVPLVVDGDEAVDVTPPYDPPAYDPPAYTNGSTGRGRARDDLFDDEED